MQFLFEWQKNKESLKLLPVALFLLFDEIALGYTINHLRIFGPSSGVYSETKISQQFQHFPVIFADSSSTAPTDNYITTHMNGSIGMTEYNNNTPRKTLLFKWSSYKISAAG